MKKPLHALLTSIFSFIILFTQQAYADVKIVDFSKGKILDYRSGKIYPAIKYSFKNTGNNTIYETKVGLSYQDIDQVGGAVIRSVNVLRFSSGFKANQIITQIYSLDTYMKDDGRNKDLNQARGLKGIISLQGVEHELIFLKEEYSNYKTLKVIK